MALTEFQRIVCRLIAANRVRQGESYLAGGAALNTLIDAPRISNDLDLFHDTREALEATWNADRVLLADNGFEITIVRERPAFVEAHVSRGDESVLLQWARDSAFRFFPLIEHEDFGFTLHPFDLATNKVLALVGRLEVRDWIDLIHCHAEIQPLGYLAWAACGKDAGFNPAMILREAGRSSHYSAAEIEELRFSGDRPDPADLSSRWRAMLEGAKEIIALLPPGEVGTCVLTHENDLFAGTAADLRKALDSEMVRFHPGGIRGAWPRIVS